MEMYERIRQLRKDELKMSQEAFGKRLGVSRSVIKNIELNALARPEQKLSLIKLICKEFSISEDWLLNGIGSMYMKSVTFSLDDFVKAKGMSELELEILKTYFELPKDVRKAAVNFFQKTFADSSFIKNETIGSNRSTEPTVEELETEYKKNLSNIVQRTNSSALNSTVNTIKGKVAND